MSTPALCGLFEAGGWLSDSAGLLLYTWYSFSQLGSLCLLCFVMLASVKAYIPGPFCSISALAASIFLVIPLILYVLNVVLWFLEFSACFFPKILFIGSFGALTLGGCFGWISAGTATGPSVGLESVLAVSVTTGAAR